MIKAGNIIRVPKGVAVTVAYGVVKRQRQDYVAVVDLVAGDDLSEAVVTFKVGDESGDDWRDVLASSVELVDDGVHRLTVGNRQVRGGGWGGWAPSYTTKGYCSCGCRCWENGSTAREVRQSWRLHIVNLADPMWRETELASVKRDVDQKR